MLSQQLSTTVFVNSRVSNRPLSYVLLFVGAAKAKCKNLNDLSMQLGSLGNGAAGAQQLAMDFMEEDQQLIVAGHQVGQVQRKQHNHQYVDPNYTYQ